MTPSPLVTPWEFFTGVVSAFDQLYLESHGLTYFNDIPSLERGWIWMPSVLNPVRKAELIVVETMILKAAGGRWHKARKCYFHVGKGWAPDERLLSPVLTRTPLMPVCEIRDAWSNTAHYLGNLKQMVEVIYEWHTVGFTDKDIHKAFLEARMCGYLLNPTPRKKRVAKKEDPMIAILREGGLL